MDDGLRDWAFRSYPDWDGSRSECPICKKEYPSVDHPSFQWCIPVLVKRIEELKLDMREHDHD